MSAQEPPKTELQNEEILLNIAKGVSATTGEQFFRSLVEHLSSVLKVDFAFICRIMPDQPDRVETLALCADGQIAENIEYDLKGTPCDKVIEGMVCSYPKAVAKLFPEDLMLTDLGIEAYFGIPLKGSTGEVLGHLAILHREPLPNNTQIGSTLTIFGARAAAELERKQAEEHLQFANQRLRELTSRLQSAKEEERTRIARELHDEFGQSLTSLKFDLARLKRRIQGIRQAPESDTLIEPIQDMSNLLSQLIHSTRKIATSLRPRLLDDLGLVPALEWLSRDFETRTGVPCMLSIDHQVSSETISSAKATAFFRIAQELLTNVLRHAQASQVHIRFRKDTDQLLLEVQDNGIGLKEHRRSQTGSLGLLGIQERVQALSGKFSIKGVSREGTTAIVKIPQGDQATLTS